MKKLNLSILTFTFLFMLTLSDSKAQQLEFVQGINLSFFGKGSDRFERFISDPVLGYDMGLNFCMYPHEPFSVVLSAHLFHQKGSAFYRLGEDIINSEISLKFDTRYIVLGLQPYIYKNKNKALEIGIGIEAAIAIQNNSLRYTRSIVQSSNGINNYFSRTRYRLNRPIGFLGKLNVGYNIKLGNKCEFIPRLVFRLANLKFQETINKEKSIGLELGFRI